jgi:hypothetical protein
MKGVINMQTRRKVAYHPIREDENSIFSSEPKLMGICGLSQNKPGIRLVLSIMLLHFFYCVTVFAIPADKHRTETVANDSKALSKYGADGVVCYYAVICGIENYPGSAYDLQYPEDDAVDFRNTLLQWPNSVWKTSNITVLKSSAVTKNAVRTALQNMCDKADTDDVCVFFFSGHGTTGPDYYPYDEWDDYDEYLVTYDGLVYDWLLDYYYPDYANCIRDDELGDWMADLPTRKYVVLLDACYSGGFIKGDLKVKGIGNIVPQKGDGFAADLVAKITTQNLITPKDLDNNLFGVVITACDDDETCEESSTLKNGIFTYYLVEGMAGKADFNSNGRISAEECYQYVRPRALNYNSGQNARIYDSHSGDLDFLASCKCSISIVSPSNGSSWDCGTTNTIKWNSQCNPSSYVKIELYRSGSVVLSVISATSDDGIYDWTIPNSGNLNGAYDYRIKVTSTSDPSCYGFSDTFCINAPPKAYNSSVFTFKDTPVTIALKAVDEGCPNSPGALTYIITSLPAYGKLDDPCAGPIWAPCTTLHGNQVVYTPHSGFSSSDQFTFVANDGGNPPAGGDSNQATVSINVITTQYRNVPSQYPTIQAAINACTDFDTVVVADGTYSGPGNCELDFHGKSIIVRSANGPSNCIIDGQSSKRGFYFHSNETRASVVNGFTITRCYDGGWDATVVGSAISCYGSNPTITNSIICGNSGLVSVVYSESGSPLLTNCTICGNNSELANLLMSPGNMRNSIVWGNYMPANDFVDSAKFTCNENGWAGEGNFSTDPLFADPNNGDYHLKSQAGRCDANEGQWTKDDVTSPCIDAGDPNSDWTRELWPHGKMINMGAYGGSREASMSPSDVGNIANLNNDPYDAVTLDDLLLFVEDWCLEGIPLAGDLNRDSAVDFKDFAIFAENWYRHKQ